jgi:hypothetical protein
MKHIQDKINETSTVHVQLLLVLTPQNQQYFKFIIPPITPAD